jgi:putative intracellular protease/amidase
MASLTIYTDEALIAQVRAAAAKRGEPVSRFCRGPLLEAAAAALGPRAMDAAARGATAAESRRRIERLTREAQARLDAARALTT